MAFFSLSKPEVTTIVRWLLRVVLVCFLAWLVQQRSGKDDEEEQEGDEQDAGSNETRRPGSKARAARSAPVSRLPSRRDPYPPSTVRNRRANGAAGASYAGTGPDSCDLSSLMERVAAPSSKELWEVGAERKPLQLKKRTEEEAANVKRRENTLHGHERPVTFITWNREGTLLFTCGKDKIVNVWSTPEGECLGTYKGHNGAVWAAGVTSDSRWLVTSGADRLVIVWEARTSVELARTELPGVVRCVEWAGGGTSPNPVSERFVTCHNRFGAHPPAVTVWRFDGTVIEELMQITSMPTLASQVRWGRGDYFVASAHENGELIFWRSDTGAEVKRLKASDSGISKFDFSHDRELVATASHDKSVRVWDLGKGSEWRLIYSLETDRPLNAVAFGPVTHAAAVGAPPGRPGRCTVVVAGGQDARDVTTSKSTSEQFGCLLLRLGVQEKLPCELKADGVTKGHFGPVHTLAFSRDGSMIASGSEDGCVRLHLLDRAAQEEAGPGGG